MFFVFDIRNFSNIDYDIDFVKCFIRDQKKMKNAIQQEVQYDPVQEKDFTKRILVKAVIVLFLPSISLQFPTTRFLRLRCSKRVGAGI